MKKLLKRTMLLAAVTAVTATTAAAATLTEGFEAAKTGSYTATQVVGDACTWNLSNAGVYGDNARSGSNSLRLGTTASSSATMASNKSGGAGTITFYGRQWSAADGNATIAVQYSTNSGSSWTTAGTATLSSTTYTKYSYTANASGSVRVRLLQTAGKRALIDDLSVTDYSATTTTPSISSPANNSTTDFGTLEPSVSKTVSIVVKGANLTSAASVSVSGTGFSVNATTLTAAKVNGTSGATLQVTFKSATAGSHTGTLTISSGSASVKVNLKATVASAASITSPANGTTINFGTVAASTSSQQSLVVKGSSLTSATTVSVSGTGFTVNSTSLSASKVNSTAGATLQLSFKSATAGSHTGTLTLKNGTQTVTVSLKATVSASSGGTTATAAFTSPTAGSTVNFGTVTASKSASSSIVVKGTNFTSATTVSVSGTGFTVGSTSLSATKVNSTTGATLMVYFKSASAGTFSGTVTLKSGTLSRTVSLKATVGDAVAPQSSGSDVTIGNEPSGYYSTCEGKNGQALLTALKTKIYAHTAVSYAKLWTSYKTTDTKSNGKIWDMYSTKEFTYSTNQCGSYTKIGDCYNREHSFPKSWFNDATPMYTDLFHLIPTDGFVNNQRANNPFGVCAGGTYVASSGTVKPLGKLGKSTYSGYTGTVWEPDDQFKGDFARSYFYMVTAYNDKIASWSSPMLAGNAYPGLSTWAMNMLLEWNALDPVSQKELDRQEAVYAIQKNRNPFIDHPELADYIWGSKKSTAWKAPSPSQTTGGAWVEAKATDPAIAYPADGAIATFGTVAAGSGNVGLLRVIGRNLDPAAVTAAIDTQGGAFGVAPATVAVAQDDNSSAYYVEITFTPTEPGGYETILTLSSGSLSNQVKIRGEAISGLPALQAGEVTDNSFKARWIDMGETLDNNCYRLDVFDRDGLLEGYPKMVDASAQEWDVTGLNPLTIYNYTLTSATMQSNIVEVETGGVTPSLSYTYANGAVNFATLPDIASDVAEVQLDAANFDDGITLTVNQPFQISLDKTNWSREIAIDPDMTDRVYVRLGAAPTGLYLASLRATAVDYVSDGVCLTAQVAKQGMVCEDFEADPYGMDTYADKSYFGTGSVWNLIDAGIWKDDKEKVATGSYAVRMGKTSSSTIEMTHAPVAADKVSVSARSWSATEGGSFTVDWSSDGDVWNQLAADPATTDGIDYKTYDFTLPANTAPRYLRIRQTAGARFMIDDVAISATPSAAEAVSADSDDDYLCWDAYSPSAGTLTVESKIDAPMLVVGIDGIVYADTNVQPGTTTLPLAGGQLYVVHVGGSSRTVAVK